MYLSWDRSRDADPEVDIRSGDEAARGGAASTNDVGTEQR